MLSRIFRELFIALVRLYQIMLSPVLGGHCRFEPTCSRYVIDAVRTRGVLRGLLLGAWRILRCNPFSKGGFDPVPPVADRSQSDDTTREMPGS